MASLLPAHSVIRSPAGTALIFCSRESAIHADEVGESKICAQDRLNRGTGVLPHVTNDALVRDLVITFESNSAGCLRFWHACCRQSCTEPHMVFMLVRMRVGGLNFSA